MGTSRAIVIMLLNDVERQSEVLGIFSDVCSLAIGRFDAWSPDMINGHDYGVAEGHNRHQALLLVQRRAGEPGELRSRNVENSLLNTKRPYTCTYADANIHQSFS